MPARQHFLDHLSRLHRFFPSAQPARAWLLAVIVVIVPLATDVAAEPDLDPECPLRIRVVGEDGAGIAGVDLTAVGGDASSASDAAGRLCLHGLAPGRHRLLAVKEGFSVTEVDVELDAVQPLELEIRLNPIFGDQMVVTATRSLKRLDDVPIQIEVVDRELIERTAARNLAEIIEWAPGVRVESNCQTCNEPGLRMLGLEGAYAQLLIDGQPTVSSLALVYGIEQLPSRLIESVEVVKGGGSALYGAGAVGGVINLIPHQPSESDASLETRFGNMSGATNSSLNGFYDWASEDRQRSLTLFASFDRVDPFDVDGDGFTEVAKRRSEASGLRFENYLLEDKGRLTAEINRTYEDRRGGDRLDLPPEQANIAEDIQTERLGASLRFLHSPSARFDYRLVASLSRTDRDSYYGAGMDPDAFGRTENPLLVADAQFNRHGERGTLTWGAQASRDEVLDLQLGRGRAIDEVYSNWGLFLQDDRRLGKEVTLLYGARADLHSEVDDAIVSPRAALLWSPRSDLTLRASWASGFRPPVVFNEDLHIALLGGGQAQVIRNSPDLAEETSNNAMVSATWRPTVGRRGAMWLELGLFHTAIDDLFFDREADDPATEGIFEFEKINFGDAKVEGAELNFGYQHGSRISVEFSWVEQSARFGEPDPDFGSRDFFRTPERYGSATFTWATKPVDLFIGARFTGPMQARHFAGFIPADRLETTPSFLTFDVNLARAFEVAGRELTITLGARNITDEFQEDLDRGPDRDSDYVYGPRFPRSFFTGFKVDL